MDEPAAASTREDGAENKSCSGDKAPENSADTSVEDTANRDGVFCCQHCGETFREEAALLEHHHQHLQQNVYLGDQPDNLHDAETDGKKAHFCTSCSLSFVDMSELHLHMRNHDQMSLKESDVINSGETKQQSYECPDCGKSYVVIGHFLNHQRSHRQPSKSVFHDLEHLKKKSFQCESCGRNYSRASALDAHRRCHEEKLVKSKNRSSGDGVQTGESEVEMKPSEAQTEDGSEKLYKCSCGKAFSTTLRLKTHQRFSRNSQCSSEEIKHKPKKGSNEFYCSECKKAFSGHIALFNHQRWHANHSDDSAKRFSCEECGKVFMTLTFYYRHQRTAHSDETPAKSFLHQVCQLQKKAFECKDCGLKFSRESALHSHQLQHTDVFRETEKEAQMHSSLSPHNKIPESGWKGTEHVESLTGDKVQPESFPPTGTVEESHISETDEDVESYEPGDFNVQVISASESEDEVDQDVNPDLELLCESDQEVRDEGDADVFPKSLVAKPEMDLKIVQIDFEETSESALSVRAGSEAAEERYDCPDCYRWFSSPSSLRVHRMWHVEHKRKQQTRGQSEAPYTCQTCGHEASSYEARCNHMQTYDDQSPSSDLLNHDEGLEMKTLTCNECGKGFSRLSALVSHQSHHPKRKRFQCPDCTTSYLHAASLFNHMKTCTAQKRENNFVSKKAYNPKKTLLGPKIYHCEQCGKGFWSLGAYSHHKQNQTECVDLRLRKGIPGSLHSVNGRSRSGIKVACPVCGRKFRHKGIMALHMRKHENGNHKCELCSRSFRLFSSLLRHQVVHSDQLLPPPIKSFQHQVEQLKKNTYSCPDCGKLFSRAKALQFHMKSHGYETGRTPSSTAALETLQCATCLAHFSSKGSLKAHQKLCVKKESHVAMKTEPPENNDTLVMEKDEMARSDQLKAHTDAGGELKKEKHIDVGGVDNRSSADLKYKCNKCDRSFSVVGALNFHKRVHAEDKTTKSNLAISLMFKKSKKEEPGKGLFHCSECGRRFTTNSALGSHKRWHREKKCSRSSLKEDDVKPVSHKAEDGPFQCNKCGKQFFNHRVLQRHQIFNPQCQTKIDTNKNAENDGTPKQFSLVESDRTAEHGSLLVSDVEAEHCKMVEPADLHENKLLEHISEQGDENCSQSDSLASTLRLKAHQCPLCSMTFAKARGLRAHKWQAHSKRTKNKAKLPLSAKKEPTDSNRELNKSEDLGPINSSAVGRGGKKIRSDFQPVKTLDCGNQFSPAGVPPDHKRVSLDVKQESKLEIQTSPGEIPSPLGRLSEHSVKCLFKCGKCGKAFQTEEQLGTHKLKGKTRPYCCALCCHGFWTENQLQQHLAWHDEVRCRLPNEVRFRLSAAMTTKPLKPDDKGKCVPPSTMKQSTLLPTSQAQGGHKCQHCGKAFLSPSALQKHKTQQCNGSGSYHCSICPRTFSQIQDLIDHHQECINDYKNQSTAPAAVS